MSSRTYRVIRRPAFVAALTALAVLTLAAPALAADPRIPLPSVPVDLPASGFCENFAVHIELVDFNQYIIRSTTAPNGTVTLRFAGRARATVTRVDTGESVSFNISGPGTLTINPDGSFSGNLAGPNLLWTARANLANFPDVPTVSYTTGHVTFAVDSSGQTTSYNLAGGARQTDVCAVLARSASVAPQRPASVAAARARARLGPKGAQLRPGTLWSYARHSSSAASGHMRH